MDDVKEEHDIQINQEYCGSNNCRFLFAHYFTEKETQANSHFYSLIQLAEMINRTVVLVNVQNSKLGSCMKLPFEFYYDIEQLQALFPKVNFITQKNFLEWTKQRYYKPSTVFRYIEQDGKPNTMRNMKIDIDLLLKDECLDQFDLKFKSDDDSVSMMIYIGVRNYWYSRVKNVILTKYLTTHLDLKEEVMIIRHELRNHLFPSKGNIVPLPYAGYLVEAAKNVKKQLGPYVGIHWRMESVRIKMMPSCAKGLIKYIKFNSYIKYLGINEIIGFSL